MDWHRKPKRVMLDATGRAEVCLPEKNTRYRMCAPFLFKRSFYGVHDNSVPDPSFF